MTKKHKEANKHTHKKLYEQKQRFFENKTTKKRKKTNVKKNILKCVLKRGELSK